MKKVIKGLVFTVICITILVTSMFVGAKYSEYEDMRTTKIEECIYDEEYDGYLITEVTRNGFGRMVERYIYYVKK